MNPDCTPLRGLQHYATGNLLAHEEVNAAIRARFERLRDDPDLRRTHKWHGRYENVYIDLTRIPQLEPVVSTAYCYAQQLLRRHSLRYGFWFNEMGPGSLTSLHTHEENEELLSCVYYVSAPPHSGRLVLQAEGGSLTIEPQSGQFVFFKPDLPHEVETNRSTEIRLSVAFNFGSA